MRNRRQCHWCGEFHPPAPLASGQADGKILVISDFAWSGEDGARKPADPAHVSLLSGWFGRAFSSFRFACLSACAKHACRRPEAALAEGWSGLRGQACRAKSLIVLGQEALETVLECETGENFRNLEGAWIASESLPEVPIYVFRHPRDLDQASSNRHRQEELWLKMREMARFWMQEFWNLRKPLAWAKEVRF